MTLRFYEISESRHFLQNPFSEAKLMLLGDICQLRPGLRQLDLACGRGEMLARWASAYGITGTGVDISAVFLEAARRRAEELGVAGQLTFVQGDAALYEPDPAGYDVVSCIGATWIGGGTVGTIDLMRRGLKPAPDSLLLVGDVYWLHEPTDAELKWMGVERGEWAVGLDGLLDRFEAAGADLLEMVISSPDDWDRYEAPKWMTTHRWLREHRDDPDVAELRAWIARGRREFLTVGRRCCGWGVFVLKPAA
jgi:SAM-dependent methyltransferase